MHSLGTYRINWDIRLLLFGSVGRLKGPRHTIFDSNGSEDAELQIKGLLNIIVREYNRRDAEGTIAETEAKAETKVME